MYYTVFTVCTTKHFLANSLYYATHLIKVLLLSMLLWLQ